MLRGSVTVVEVMANTGAARAAANHRSPFVGHTPGERPAPNGQIGARLSAGTISSVTQVATWSAGADALGLALGAALGLTVPRAYR